MIFYNFLAILSNVSANGETVSAGSEFIRKFTAAFITENRYLLLLDGLRVTLILSMAGLAIGVIIGITMAFLKLSKNKFLRGIAHTYIDIIRGTPSMVQLLVIYFVILNSPYISKIFIASIAFGVNSGAYVAEIIRAGILSIDRGQMEAGRSLGLSHASTMRYIILPQAIKNILPALANEFIVLIKETAIVGYIPVYDLTKAATSIQSRTYDMTYPIIATAIIYYTLIKMLTILMSSIEKRMRKADLHV